MHRATVELELTVGTSKLTGRIDDLPDATASFRTSQPIQKVSLECGIVYADASDENLLTAEVANVTLVAGP